MATFQVTINTHKCWVEGTTLQELENDIAAAAYFGERHGWDPVEMRAAFPAYMEMRGLQCAINKAGGTAGPKISAPMTAAAEEAIVQFRLDHPTLV